MISDFQRDGDGPRYHGVFAAIVTNIVDEAKLGRVELKFPWLGKAGEAVRAWATLLTPYADDDQGFFVLPAVHTQVVVAFEAGDLRRPYVLGACWNGKEKPPEVAQKPNDKRLIKTRSGSLLEFDDKDGAAKVTLSMKSGHRLVLEDSGNTVTLQHSGGSVIVLEASGKITIEAKSHVDVHATTLNVHAPEANFDNKINCVTLTASGSVVSPSYAIGAGNQW